MEFMGKDDGIRNINDREPKTSRSFIDEETLAILDAQRMVYTEYFIDSDSGELR